MCPELPVASRVTHISLRGPAGRVHPDTAGASQRPCHSDTPLCPAPAPHRAPGPLRLLPTVASPPPPRA